MKKLWRSGVARAVVMTSLLALVALPAMGAGGGSSALPGLQRMSQVVAARYYIAHPEQAPAGTRAQFVAARKVLAQARTLSPEAPPFGDRFNNDVYGLPQNEESVSVCQTEGSGVVFEGTNDYRGLLNDLGNFTGWHLSLDGGNSLQNEGLLPEIDSGGVTYPSGGDPVNVALAQPGGQCDLYAASLNYDFSVDPPSSAVGLYRTDLATASSCDTSESPFHANPDCWPDRVVVATNASASDHFLDKEWMDAGDTGDGVHVWVTYTDFTDAFNPDFCCTAQIKAVRCDADLSNCTAPIVVSDPNDLDVQFSDVTIGPDHRTYISWVRVLGERTGTAQRFVIKTRVAEPGSTDFGPTGVITTIKRPLPFGGFLHANDFRIASVPKNTVKIVNGSPRMFVTWDVCAQRPGDTICEEPQIRMSWSDDLGANWSAPSVISAGGDNYFPTIDNDTSDGKIVVAYYTNRFDPQFHNRQDVELVTLDATSGAVVKRQRVTSDQSNETEADPFLGGFFIGDYIEVSAMNGGAWVGYNANIHDERFVGLGVPVPQQDNFVSSVPE